MQEIDFPLLMTLLALGQVVEVLGLRRRLLARVLIGGLFLLFLYALVADLRAPLAERVVVLWTVAALLVVLGTSAIGMWRSRNDPSETETEEPSPTRLALIVILLTGGAAVAMLVYQGAPRRLSDLAIPGGALAGTLLIAWLAWRFATGNAAEIGEARFDTSRAPGPAEGQP